MKLPTSSFVLFLALLPQALPAQVIIKPTKAVQTSAASGDQMYRSYCAVCHGVDGKGNGPAAPALKVTVPDLTLLSRSNNGKFPEERVFQSIDGTLDISSHGSKDMPVWGQVFSRMPGSAAPTVNLRIVNLSKYIESIQQK